jgi:DNA binding domain, excisionase family
MTAEDEEKKRRELVRLFGEKAGAELWQTYRDSQARGLVLSGYERDGKIFLTDAKQVTASELKRLKAKGVKELSLEVLEAEPAPKGTGKPGGGPSVEGDIALIEFTRSRGSPELRQVQPDRLYSVPEVARLLRVSEESVRRWARGEGSKALKAYKTGGAWRFRGRDLVRFLER